MCFFVSMPLFLHVSASSYHTQSWNDTEAQWGLTILFPLRLCASAPLR
jgi:hypothetical protein